MLSFMHESTVRACVYMKKNVSEVTEGLLRIPECSELHLHGPGLGTEGGNDLALLLDKAVQHCTAAASRLHWL